MCIRIERKLVIKYSKIKEKSIELVANLKLSV